MGFEAKVLSVVEEVLGTPKGAGFQYGTLFVLCSSDQASIIKNTLQEKFIVMNIVSSEMPDGNEWAFDFT